MSIEEPRKRGRPSWTPTNLAEVEGMAARGMQFKQIAAALGIHVFTLIRKRRQLNELNDALTRGRARGETVAASKLYEAVQAGDINAIKFYLERRCGWREQTDVNLTGKVEVEQHVQAREAQLELYRAMTMEERRTIREIQQRAQGRIEAKKRNKAIETTATPISEQ